MPAPGNHTAAIQVLIIIIMSLTTCTRMLGCPCPAAWQNARMQERQDGDAADRLVLAVRDAVERAVAVAGSTEAVKPPHRVRFHWPPHPISADYHVLASEWTGRAEVSIDGEAFEVKIARTPYGVFGRCDRLWHEAKGQSIQDVLKALVKGAEPLVVRQRAIGAAIGRDGRYSGSIRDLAPEELVALLYCEDRDAGIEAGTQIETHASTRIFGPALVEILRDRRHPMRAAAHWVVLDLFEDLPSFFPTLEEQRPAVDAIRRLVIEATHDYARATYKAGVVLGGHICTHEAADALMECLASAGPIGRRAAIHGCFHLAEWLPERKESVVASLERVASADPEPLLRDYAAGIAKDVASGAVDHVVEPMFPNEP